MFVVVGKLVVFALFGCYHKRWRYIDQMDFESLIRAVVVASLASRGHALPDLARRHRSAARRDRARLPAHARVRAGHALPRADGDRAAVARRGDPSRHARGADRRRGQRRPAGGWPSSSATRSCAWCRSATWTTTRACAASAWPASRCSARRRSCRRCSTTPSPTRSSSPSPRRRACCASGWSPRAASAGSPCARCPRCSSCSRAASASAASCVR